jgi:hypothetical protein
MAGFELFVDDNYHYMDEKSRYSVGSFATYEEALARAKAIVDEFLEEHFEPGMTSKDLYEGYVGFGEDPFIVPAGTPRFSAWDYARAKCEELCRDEDAVASVLRYPEWPPELSGFRAVLLAGLAREDLDENERKALNTFCRAVEDYPDAMPRDNRYHWFRLESANIAYTVYLYRDRFQLSADASLPEKVEWVVHFRGSGRLDRRDGDAVATLDKMRRAAADPDFTLKVSAR